MLNIMIPMAGENKFFPEGEFVYPKPLIEINGEMMIQHVIENLQKIDDDVVFTFVVNNSDCAKFHLDNTLNLLTDGKCNIVKVTGETKGAICSCLLGIDNIDNNDQLIIANMDQVINADLRDCVKKLSQFDAGVIAFESTHPRWSYVRQDENNMVVETAEKRPISKSAIAGFYYFKHGKDFVKAAMRTIEKDASLNGMFYTSATLNELVLDNKNIGLVHIENKDYVTFYTPRKVKEYESRLICN
ncbi:putative nucleotidyltransferase [Denitrovibrio acetiphilus DSM 12809]|uniref:Putative nucleotidyltransferase n=1 Tax=Denitrovibrio acetiphilus (strain DSM 12809 / NBRC 114555 / N2460) TaxID=522772 RepID=D4H584_DENA2|nr:glycosyltransferase family 2 protein [Denitrovibrio acetiphilus]ADD69440.1 putative nucleotidyltransferase [Denitrovibrio acetiphilus DSM 12809]